MASGSVPPAVRTIQQKIEDAWDGINKIFSQTPQSQLNTLAEFMTIYSPSSTLVGFIDDLFKGVVVTPRGNRAIGGNEVKSHLFNQLGEINNIPRANIVNSVLNTNGGTLLPTRLMCLFICGLISFDSMSFEKWMKMQWDVEKDYIREFLSVFSYPETVNVYLNVKNGVEEIDANNRHTIPDKLFLSSGIPEDTRNVVIMDSFPEADPWLDLRASINRNDTITSGPVFWYAYVIRDCTTTSQASTGPSTTAQAWADPDAAAPADAGGVAPADPDAAAPADAGGVAPADPDASAPADAGGAKCIGLVYKERNYIFSYNFPKFDRNASNDTVTLWRNYITDPYKQYANILQSYTMGNPPKIHQDTAFIGKVTLENPMLIYIYVLVMGVYGGNRNFYAYGSYSLPENVIQDALVAGMTCNDYLAQLSPLGGGTPLTIAGGLLSQGVMERLANAHLALMKKNPSFIFEVGSIDENYTDLIASTCPVKYEWVFRSAILCKSQSWIQKILTEIDDVTKKREGKLDPYLGVLRRITFWMGKKIPNLDPFMTTARKLTKKVENGAKVDGDKKKRIVLDLQKFGEKKDIFNQNSTLDKFLSMDSNFRAAMQKYFVGEWHPDNVFGKYIVHNKNNDTYEVRDSAQMEIDNNDIETQEVREERVPSSSSESASSHSGYVSSDSESSLPSVKGAWKPKTQNKPTGSGGNGGYLPPIKELNKLVDVLDDQSHRNQGGLGEILRELEDLFDVKGMNDEDKKKKEDKVKQGIINAQAEFKNKITGIKSEVETLTKELEQTNTTVKQQRDDFETQIKTLRGEIDQKNTDLRAALLKEADLLKQKNEDDAKMQALEDEARKLTEELDKLNQELDSLKKELAESKAKEMELTAKVGDLEAEVKKLTQEIEDGKTKTKNLLASDASKQAELDKLAAIETQLADALAKQKLIEGEKAKLETEIKRLNLLLTDDKAQLNEQILEKLKLTEEARKLRDEIEQYELQLKEITEKVKRAIVENEKQTSDRMWRIHDKVDETIQGELQESQLLRLLREKNYTDFMNFVKIKDAVKKQFTLPALFLTYESIGATWRLIENLADKKDTTAFMAEKLIHDIRLFQTIKTHDEHIMENYTTKYFKKFLEAFKLLEFDDGHEIIDTL